MNQQGPGAASSDWLHPPAEQEGLTRFVETLRERKWIVLICMLITTGVSIVYVETATKVYEAEADLLITPVSASNTTLVGLGLIRESTDPTRDVETAARLVTTADVAERVKEELDTDESTGELLTDVEAEPVAQSNIVAITARDSSPQMARDVANAFAEQTVEERTDLLHEQIEAVIPALRARAEAEDPAASGTPDSLRTQVSQLETLLAGQDPTMQVETLAQTPSSPVAPRALISIAAGALAGLVLGLTAAFAFQVLDPRLRREDQLRRRYRLPILTRIPQERRSRAEPLSPTQLSPATLEAYRTLRGTLAAASVDPEASHAVLVTGASPSVGKTTTAINLAASLAVAGKRVILIEADLRRPAIGRALETKASAGVVGVLLENVALEDALVTTSAFGPNLQLLLADYEGGWISELFALPAAKRMVDEAKQAADYVIIDSPPLTDVIDALPVAAYVDDVLITVRLGKTRLSKLEQLGELLAENNIRPLGFAVVGAPRPRAQEYHYYTKPDAPKGVPGLSGIAGKDST